MAITAPPGAAEANALQSQPPLGLLQDFSTSGSGRDAHTLDLKAQGARLFVDAARIFALQAGIAADARGVADLDKWLVRFGIDPVARHNALADAYASAQLFQIALHRVARESGSETRNRLCDLLMLAGEQAALRRRQVGL